MSSLLTQSGFSEAQRLEALTLRTRIQNGENIPLSELVAFILAGEKDLEANRLKALPPKPVKDADISFF